MKCYLVAYDIADTRLREQIARRLLRDGLRVQESVFEITVRSDAAFRRLVQDLHALCPPPFPGQLRWYGLNRDAFAAAGAIGAPAPCLPAAAVVV
ncbi:CRISPR-associated endonuclease Cas2 [Tahibacter caeni]|uniref:CRISPR-associated endonuclease Cas2 n=1 Tax=Tahibacter caeni TaxID=1453545 RepID=UPI00214917E7|nr:CRISPR-associated endonuclease Cas2 [Tahibacter caeni]